MKAITIRQPWASLLVTGKKHYETRGWSISYTGPIAIHAAKWPVRRTIDALASAGRWDTLEQFERLFQRPGEVAY